MKIYHSQSFRSVHKWQPAIVFLGYLFIGIVSFWNQYQGISTRLFGIDWDFAQSVWFIDWTPHALTHGLNPFFSNSIFVPTGVNLAQNTASPLLGLLTAPFGLVLSPLVRANLLLVLAMPISATAAFVILNRWKVWLPAAALGGLMYGFSPYMVGQSFDHIELVFVPLPPFIVLTVVSILQRRGSPRRLGVQLGLLVVAQYLISPEILTITAIFTAGALICVAVWFRVKWPDRRATVLPAAGVALAVVVALLSYPVWMMIAGPQHFVGSTWPTVNPYHTDLLGFIAPGPLQKISFGMRSTGNRLYTSTGTNEAGGYIGIPILFVMGILMWRSRRSPRMQLIALLLFVAALLSLGPHLSVNGRLTNIPLPFLVLQHLPLLDDILPTRIGFALGTCVAAVIAFGLDDLHRSPIHSVRFKPDRKWWAWERQAVALTVLTLAIVVLTQLPQGPPVSRQQSQAQLPMALRRSVPAGSPIAITYPYATEFTIQAMLWQVEDGFRFRLLGGYAYHPDSTNHASLYPSPMNPTGLQEFLIGQDAVSYFGLSRVYGPALSVSPELVASTRLTLQRYNVRLIMVDTSVSGSKPVVELFTEAYGPRTLAAHHFYLWEIGKRSTSQHSKR